MLDNLPLLALRQWFPTTMQELPLLFSIDIYNYITQYLSLFLYIYQWFSTYKLIFLMFIKYFLENRSYF